MRTLEKIVLGATLAVAMGVGGYYGYRHAESKPGYRAADLAGNAFAGASAGALAVLIGYYQFFCADKDKSNKIRTSEEADSE
jgi:hypothetical protein